MKDPEIGAPHRADRARRVPHVRHGLDVPQRQGLQPGWPAVRVGRPQAPAGLQGVGEGPDAPRGHLRGRRDGVGDRRGVDVLDPRRAHDPVLHLLLDVRLPAHRRLDLGDGRPARPRLPDRSHRGAYDAHRRGTPARRRALPAAGGDQPRGRALRPGVRLRGQPRHAGRSAPDVRLDRRAPARRGRHLLHDRLQRAGRPAGRAGRRRRRGHPARNAPRRGAAGRRRRGQPAPRAAARVGCRLPLDRQGPAPARRGMGRRRRHLVGHVVERAGPRRDRDRGVGVAAPVRGRTADPVRDRQAQGRRRARSLR